MLRLSWSVQNSARLHHKFSGKPLCLLQTVPRWPGMPVFQWRLFLSLSSVHAASHPASVRRYGLSPHWPAASLPRMPVRRSFHGACVCRLQALLHRLYKHECQLPGNLPRPKSCPCCPLMCPARPQAPRRRFSAGPWHPSFRPSSCPFPQNPGSAKARCRTSALRMQPSLSFPAKSLPHPLSLRHNPGNPCLPQNHPPSHAGFLSAPARQIRLQLSGFHPIIPGRGLPAHCGNFHPAPCRKSR